MNEKPRIDTVHIHRHEETVISMQALHTVNNGISSILRLIDPNASYFDSTYEQDFAKIEAWVKAHMTVEVSHE